MADEEKDGKVIDLMEALKDRLREDAKTFGEQTSEQIEATPPIESSTRSETSDANTSSSSTASPSTTSSGASAVGGNGEAKDVEVEKRPRAGTCATCEMKFPDVDVCILVRDPGMARAVLRHKVKTKTAHGPDTRLCGPVLTKFVYRVFYQFTFPNGAGGFKGATIERSGPIDHEAYVESLEQFLGSRISASATDEQGRPIVGASDVHPVVEVLTWAFIRAE